MFRIEELSMKIKRFFSNIYKKFINIIFSKIYGKITYTKQKTQNIKFRVFLYIFEKNFLSFILNSLIRYNSKLNYPFTVSFFIFN